jgi:hypothetical protein
VRLFPKRRWLRFSVRTLLVAVTIFCVWLGWQVKIVRERARLRIWAADHGTVSLAGDGSLSVPAANQGWRFTPSGKPAWRPRSASGIPWYRKMLGDQAVEGIWIYAAWREEHEVARIDAQFPEAALAVNH